MKQSFLIECPRILKEGLLANQSALESFQSLNFFKQRSISNYVMNADNEKERTQRLNEVLKKLKETQGFSRI